MIPFEAEADPRISDLQILRAARSLRGQDVENLSSTIYCLEGVQA